MLRGSSRHRAHPEAALLLLLAAWACSDGERAPAAPIPPEPEASLESAAPPPGGECFEGELAVEEIHHFPPARPGCQRSEAVRWSGRARWTLRQEAREATGWLLPRHDLSTLRVEWEIEQSGFEEHCVQPDPARDLTGRSELRMDRVVEAVSRRGVSEPAVGAPAGAIYHAPPLRETPSGRPPPEPRPSPDRFAPGQYELVLPIPCTTFDAPGTRAEGGPPKPAPHPVRCAFGQPIRVEFRPGRRVSDHSWACADEARYAAEDGRRLVGERHCERSAPGEGRSSYAARWDLARRPCAPEELPPGERGSGS